jgi:ketosteroid isomerase-like protein
MEVTTRPDPCSTADRREIESHVRGLWEAYMRKDREAIRRGHCADWRGFQVRSRSVVRGLDAYMRNADAILSTMDIVSYDILDMEVDVQGDLAVVAYVARERFRDPTGAEQGALVRCLDVYRREPDGWNQWASNINLLLDEAPVATAPPDERQAP